MKILITGITGRVGANIARHFLNKDVAVRGLVWKDDRQTEKLELLNAEIVEGDLALRDDVVRAARGVDVIIHLGAAFQAGGPFTPEQYFDTNVKGVFNVLEAALALGDRLRHLIFVSTDATVDKYPPGGILEPLREDSLPLTATAWYGYSKALGEHLTDRYFRHENLKNTIMRFASVWGAGEVLDFPQFHLDSFLELFKERKDSAGIETYRKLKFEHDRVNGRPCLIVARDENGRSWKKHNLEVRDIVHAFDRAVGNPNTFGKIYQLGSKTPFRWDELIPYMSEKTGIPYCRVNLATTPTFYEYDLTAARRDFQYNPWISIRDMIDEAVRFRREGGGPMIATRVSGASGSVRKRRLTPAMSKE